MHTRTGPQPPRTRRRLGLRRSLTALALAVGSLAALLTAAPTASADVQLCDKFGSAVVQNRYFAQNNAWGTSQPQCINVTSSGFSVTRADGSSSTSGAPKSYPSMVYGCHYNNCSPGTNLPRQIRSIGSASTSISYGYNTSNSVYNASYDIWLDPTPRRDGVNQTEIMVWLNRVGPIQPIGSRTGTATIGGRQWEVWTGSNGANRVISFVAPSAISSYSFDVMDFADAAIARGMATQDWYLTSIQAGFEPWQNGVGLAVNSFSASVN